MVQAEKIYWAAVGIFRQCRDDVDYQYLCGLELSPKMDNGLEIRNALRNVRELEDAIRNQDFVIMRYLILKNTDRLLKAAQRK